MKFNLTPVTLATLAAGLSIQANANDMELSGNLGIESRVFTQDAAYQDQSDYQVALHGEAEFYWDIGDNGNSLTFTPYARIDSEDSERNLVDVRELMYLHLDDEWELRVGVGKVFWGVTETLHLVDVINQTDTLASFDGEEKLGQPMVHFSTVQDWGVLDAFALPYFRERDFAGSEGRLRPQLPVKGQTQWESGAEETHLDYALRWSNSFDDWDVGVSWFSGTNREAEFFVNVDEQGVSLTPFYGLIDQIGLDVQYIYESWLWKLEAINRSSDTVTEKTAVVGGFEYTLVGFNDTAIDLGLVMEYAYDDSDEQAARQNDVSLATRWAFNDAESSEVLIGFSQDLDYSDSQSLFIEGSTRIGESTVVTVDAWLFHADEFQDLGYQIRNDDFIQLDVSYYF